MRGAYLEVLGDLIGSLAVVAAAVLILIAGWTPLTRSLHFSSWWSSQAPGRCWVRSSTRYWKPHLAVWTLPKSVSKSSGHVG